MQMRRYVVGERDGGGGGGGIYRSVGITWAAGNGFKIQAHPCLSLGNGFQAEPIARVGSPESCLKPISAALVIPAPQPASASPAPIPLTRNVSSRLHHLYQNQVKKEKWHARDIGIPNNIQDNIKGRIILISS